MKVGDLVKHKSIDGLVGGLVTELQGEHCTVVWLSGGFLTAKGKATLEVNRMLEVISERQ